MLLLTWFRRVSNPQMQGLRQLTFIYSSSCVKNGSVRYELTCEDGSCRIVIIPKFVPKEQAFIRDVEDAFAEKLLSILKKYKAGSWNGFHRVDKIIADGSSFTLNVRFQNGKEIHAHGYMHVPPHFREFRQEMDELFMPLYPEEQDINRKMKRRKII